MLLLGLLFSYSSVFADVTEVLYTKIPVFSADGITFKEAIKKLDKVDYKNRKIGVLQLDISDQLLNEERQISIDAKDIEIWRLIEYISGQVGASVEYYQNKVSIKPLKLEKRRVFITKSLRKHFINPNTKVVTKDSITIFLRKFNINCAEVEWLQHQEIFMVKLYTHDSIYFEALIKILESGLSINLPSVSLKGDDVFNNLHPSRSSHFRNSHVDPAGQKDTSPGIY